MAEPLSTRRVEPSPVGTPADTEPAVRSGVGAWLRSDGLVADTLAVLGGLVVLGLLCGVLWWLLASPAEFTKTPDGGVMTEVQLGRQFSADGTYVVIALVAGLAAGLGLSWWRGRDPFATSLLLLLGSALAAGVMAGVGHLLGPGDTEAALDVARVGARVPESLDVDVWTVYLAWPVAVLAGALVVLLGAPVDTED